MMSENSLISKEAIQCLDKGFVRLVDSMGSDDSIVQAARVSYGKGTKKRTQDRGLIRYLMRHKHTTPFEMVEFKFHAKMPIFVARQWVRHRTATINEYSLRYSEARDDFYIPNFDDIHFQSTINKQGRAETEVPDELKNRVISHFEEISKRSFDLYSEMNENGIARELARAILPVNFYTEWYWKNDLHNTFHFLRLRMDAHAQYEIRVYANAMAEIIKKIVPMAFEAFEDYVLNGLDFSNSDRDIFGKNLPKRVVADLLDDVHYRITASLHKNKPRENTVDLHKLYQNQGGTDKFAIFESKWNACKIETGDVLELREFKTKLETLTNK